MLSKGTKLYNEDEGFEAIVVTDLMQYRGFKAIYADIIKQKDEKIICGAKLLKDNIALVLRDKSIMQKIGLNPEERRAIYCHELGHCFSDNQKDSSSKKREIADEVDSDTFAIEKCDVPIDVLESALKKTYEYCVSKAKKDINMTDERVQRFIQEMTARKRNIERLKTMKKTRQDTSR